MERMWSRAVRTEQSISKAIFSGVRAASAILLSQNPCVNAKVIAPNLLPVAVSDYVNPYRVYLARPPTGSTHRTLLVLYARV